MSEEDRPRDPGEGPGTSTTYPLSGRVLGPTTEVTEGLPDPSEKYGQTPKQ